MGTPKLEDLTNDNGKVYWEGIMALAAQSHTSIKLSMLCYTDKNWDKNPVVIDAVRRIIEIFGSERCIVASNHPADWFDDWTSPRNYAAFARIFDSFGFSIDQQRMLFGGNAKRIYRV